MKFEERIKPHLNELAHSLIDKEIYGHLPSITNLLISFKSDQWHRLPNDEQIYWLKKLSQMIAGRDGLSDWFGYDNQNLNQLLEITQAQIKAIERNT